MLGKDFEELSSILVQKAIVYTGEGPFRSVPQFFLKVQDHF
eukprot:XP_001706119.1 Hypothetical protein GL50803_36061 [Giardia lamblia ATCC 50803]